MLKVSSSNYNRLFQLVVFVKQSSSPVCDTNLNISKTQKSSLQNFPKTQKKPSNLHIIFVTFRFQKSSNISLFFCEKVISTKIRIIKKFEYNLHNFEKMYTKYYLRFKVIYFKTFFLCIFYETHTSLFSRKTNVRNTSK